MNVLITGGAGFIGSNLAERCVTKGWAVDIVDDLSNGHREFVPSGVRNQIYSDFSDKNVLAHIKDKAYDVVFHLAAVPRVSYSVEHPVETNDVNVSSTLRLIDACRGNVSRFVFASSSSVYGGADKLPTPVSHPKSPKSPYALQKSIIEDYLAMYEELYGLKYTALRFFNVFGKNQLGNSPYATAVSAWLDAIKRGQSMRSDGSGKQSRDMCHVDNVTQACVLAATEYTIDDYDQRVFNVACGESVTNEQVLQYLLQRFPGAAFHKAPWRAGDVMHTKADITETRAVLGYKVEMPFWPGLEKTIAWHEKNWDLIKGLTLKT